MVFPPLRRRSGATSAFTLIELLIVVAIMAILAAIAVPNFLEAQTRAKVSRARADMRSISVALESFFVDHNTYVRANQAGNSFHFESKLSALTTPVAYMTRVPGSAFAKWASAWSGLAPTDVYYYQSKRDLDDMNNGDFDSDGNYPDAGYSGAPAYASWLLFDRENGRYLWYLSTVGPDGDYDQGWGYDQTGGSTPYEQFLEDNCRPYDPTNGTVSDGDIFVRGPGGQPS